MAAVAVREKALRGRRASAGSEPAATSKCATAAIEIAGAPGSGMTLREVAEAVSGVPGYSMPGNFEPGLESMQNFLPSALTYGGGCHAVEVEVDIETCGVRILRYVVVNDSGRIINPMIVEGQIVGGVAHGIGNALFEWMGYDEEAQPITTTFADYLLPSATEVPNDRGEIRRVSPRRSIRSASRASANPAACRPPARSSRRSRTRSRRSACGSRNIR